jgi:hypothetical protein
VRDDELAYQVDDFRFPLRLAFVLRITMSLVGFQGDHVQILDALVMKRFGMKANFSIQPPDDARMDFCQPCCCLEAASFGQMVRHRYRLLLTHFRIPQRRVLALAELCATAATVQIPDSIFSVRFANGQIVLSRLPV